MQANPIPTDEVVDPESSAAEYAAGKPKRGGWKVAVWAVAALALVAFLFIPDGKQVKPVAPVAPITRPQPDVSSAVANQLKADADTKAEKAREQAAADAKAKGATTYPNAISGFPAPEPATSAMASAKPTPAELRISQYEKAAASPMEVSDVTLSDRRVAEPVETTEDKITKLYAQSKRDSDDVQAKIIAGMNRTDEAPKASIKINSDEAFLNRFSAMDTDAVRVAQPPRGELSLAPGSIIRLALMRGINTDSPGQITAQVVSNVYDSITGRRLLIPMGSRVIGVYSSSFETGQRRVVVAMSRLDLPNGKRISLSGSPAGDDQGYSGLPAEVNNHFFSMFGSSLLVGAVSLLLPKDQQTITNSTNAAGTQTAGTVLGTALNSTVQILADRNRLTKPTGTIEPGTAFSFSTTKEMLFQEYK